MIHRIFDGLQVIDLMNEVASTDHWNCNMVVCRNRKQQAMNDGDATLESPLHPPRSIRPGEGQQHTRKFTSRFQFPVLITIPCQSGGFRTTKLITSLSVEWVFHLNSRNLVWLLGVYYAVGLLLNLYILLPFPPQRLASVSSCSDRMCWSACRSPLAHIIGLRWR